MSSLQKFHRRTNSAVVEKFTTIGSGGESIGYWFAESGSSALIVAPKSTAFRSVWGSKTITRGTTSTTNGLANTNTLYSFGSSAHPAAYYCKTLSVGGYNTWYMPAKDELMTVFSNKPTVPGVVGLGGYDIYMTSTEVNSDTYWSQNVTNGAQHNFFGKDTDMELRAIRRGVGTAPSAFTTLGGGNNTDGYWLGTAGDGTSKLIVAPKSTETSRAWGSEGTLRGTTSVTDGLTNTNTLFAFGSAAHPAAYYCKTLTTGGYSTWYLPAKNEAMTIYSNRTATPFATANSWTGGYIWTSTESNSTNAWNHGTTSGNQGAVTKTTGDAPYFMVRAVRRV